MVIARDSEITLGLGNQNFEITLLKTNIIQK